MTDSNNLKTNYFFISDLHLGGNGNMQNCDFADELIDFLKSLEARSG